MWPITTAISGLKKTNCKDSKVWYFNVLVVVVFVVKYSGIVFKRLHLPSANKAVQTEINTIRMVSANIVVMMKNRFPGKERKTRKVKKCARV